MRRVAIINCHPRKGSLSDALTQTYRQTLEEHGATVQTIAVRDLEFDPLIDPQEVKQLEPDLKKAQELITWCEHLCFVFPTWWTGIPALGKGFIDRVFQSGFAFAYTKRFPKALLQGRSARIIHTMAAPVLYNHLWMGRPQVKMIREGTLSFCGFKPVKITAIGGIRKQDALQERYLEKARQAAQEDAR